MLHQEKKCFASTCCSTACSPHTMYVIIRIIWWIKLDHPVNFWKVETSLSNISAKQYACFSLAKFKVS